jgi:PHD/YefM family antitoxin component YafN of YafNO toxin-antitoxin module
LASEKSMPRTIGVNQASQEMDNLVTRIKSGREHFVLEEDGQEVAAIISISEYRDLMHEREQAQDRQRRLKQFREATRAIGEEIEQSGLSEDELMAHVEKVRQRMHDQGYDNSTAE